MEGYEGKMHPVDNYCSEYEEEVDENPKSQGSESLRDLNQGYVRYNDTPCFTSGEEDIVETRRAVREGKRVTRRLTRPGITF